MLLHAPNTAIPTLPIPSIILFCVLIARLLHIHFEAITLLSLRLAPADPWNRWLASMRSTVLDKIIEFAKISAGLNFCVRATLRLRHSRCPPDTDVLKISSLPKWASSESRYEPPCAKLASCLLERHYNSVAHKQLPHGGTFSSNAH